MRLGAMAALLTDDLPGRFLAKVGDSVPELAASGETFKLILRNLG
jgi:hypothetical protein